MLENEDKQKEAGDGAFLKKKEREEKKVSQ